MRLIHAKHTVNEAMSCRRRRYWLDTHVQHTPSDRLAVHTPLRAGRIGQIRDMGAKGFGRGDADRSEYDVGYGFRSMRASESASELVSRWKTAWIVCSEAGTALGAPP